MRNRQPDDRTTRSPKDSFITVYGRMPVLEVLQNSALTVDKVITAHNATGVDRIVNLAGKRGVPVEEASPHRVKLLAGNGKHDQGVIADVVAPRMRTLPEFTRRASRDRATSVIVLDRVGNPSNVGMIIRTATAAGIDGIVLPHVGSPGIGPLVIKASAGIAYRASIVRCGTPEEAVRTLADEGFRIYGLSGEGRSGLFRTELAPKAAFVLGNETEGLSRETSELVDEWLSIPMHGGVESLNVASATAVLCFEVTRQREADADRGRGGHGGSGRRHGDGDRRDRGGDVGRGRRDDARRGEWGTGGDRRGDADRRGRDDGRRGAGRPTRDGDRRRDSRPGRSDGSHRRTDR